jgi:hypothetical protein
MAQMIPFPMSNLQAKAGKKSKEKSSQRSQRQELLGQKLIVAGLVTEDQLAAALSHQSANGNRLGRILLNEGIISHRDLCEHVSIGDARAAAVLELETSFQNTLADLSVRHSRCFRMFIFICVISLLASCFAGNMFPLSVYICGVAAFAGIYHQLQRRHYDMHAFITRARASLLNSLKNCDSVTAIETVMLQSSKFFTKAGLQVPVSSGPALAAPADDEPEMDE